jgi:serine/threonine-protein kinase
VHLTQEGVALGTPMYMSPEQVQGQSTDHRSDLYSLGVTFYQMLAGVPPFTGDAPLAVALKHVREKPVSLAVHRPDLPAGLVSLVMKLLEKDPAQRYQSASELLRDLAKVRDQLAVVVETQTTQPKITQAEADALAPTAQDPLQAKGKPKRSVLRGALAIPRLGRRLLYVAVPLGLLAGGAGGWFARTPDLLNTQAVPETLPGLWMEPWETTVPRYPTPQAQYRYAQTKADAGRRVAAWLAVPGRFPESIETASRAYTQLIRELLRRGDAERLGTLEDELAAAHVRLGRDVFQGLSRMSGAAEAALRNDAGRVLELLGQWPNIEIMDPGLAELGYEIVTITSRMSSGAGTNAVRLDGLRMKLLGPLQIPPMTLGGEGSQSK